MSDNILTAKEWLEKEGKLDGVCENNPNYKGLSYSASEAMEEYASYKTKVLEDRILEFSVYLRNRYEYLKQDNSFGDNECSMELEDCIKEFIKYFNIKQ